jgi:hypothetical protein
MTMNMNVKMVMGIPISDEMFNIPPGYQVVSEKDLMRLLMVMDQER